MTETMEDGSGMKSTPHSGKTHVEIVLTPANAGHINPLVLRTRIADLSGPFASGSTRLEAVYLEAIRILGYIQRAAPAYWSLLNVCMDDHAMGTHDRT